MRETAENTQAEEPETEPGPEGGSDWRVLVVARHRKAFESEEEAHRAFIADIAEARMMAGPGLSFGVYLKEYDADGGRWVTCRKQDLRWSPAGGTGRAPCNGQLTTGERMKAEG